MTLLKHVAVLSNSLAGKGRSLKVTKQVVSHLQNSGINHRVFNHAWPATLHEFTSVFLVGGDGTLNYLINRYPDLNLPIALFKGGSGNDFAWKLYGNLSVEQYCRNILNEKIFTSDGGLCNEQLFLNGFGIGFDGEVVRAMGKRKLISAGHAAYLLTVLLKVLFYKEAGIDYTIGTERWLEKPFLLAIANGVRYGGGFNIAPGAKLDDGLFDLILIRKMPPLKRIFHIHRVQKGTHLKLPFVEHHLCQEVIVLNEQRIAAHVDGELIEQNRYVVKILPAKYQFFI